MESICFIQLRKTNAHDVIDTSVELITFSQVSKIAIVNNECRYLLPLLMID